MGLEAVEDKLDYNAMECTISTNFIPIGIATGL